MSFSKKRCCENSELSSKKEHVVKANNNASESSQNYSEEKNIQTRKTKKSDNDSESCSNDSEEENIKKWHLKKVKTEKQQRNAELSLEKDDSEEDLNEEVGSGEFTQDETHNHPFFKARKAFMKKNKFVFC